ncbi:gamma-glutamyl-gamma-aminobutyrate hydrolase family protein [Rhizobacter sp. J219]|uniref:gamma-glutamyl-gamma-aminobutyrate hydrolase family protein n=1 Tax=Rhizobacter sp. J219 TaxID=2898430 RepID=UPI002150CAC0|nr:gamma-glutamyl-gamma-aminobutyrate hydrolase family protein [Rhizobacter sp. J219]MCR5885728.1 gamma-glutamyl-gamma-aminobutyrate hydrolase family protein [Rhizobacter sp. J219]
MRIAISQRVDVIERYDERRDALDHRWARRIESLGWVPVPVPNSLQAPAAWARALGIDALLLTGGNDLSGMSSTAPAATERDRTEFELLDLAREVGWPVLGVCRGMQAMNMYLGGHIVPVIGHIAQRHELHGTGWPARRFAGLADGMTVNSFHGFGIPASGLAPGLHPLMQDAAGYVEAAEHDHLPWSAVMWHPEREPAPPPAQDWLRSLFETP